MSAYAALILGERNQLIPAVVLPRISQWAPSFAFLDPTGLQLHWETVVALAKHRFRSQYKMELLILYPYDMGVNRNLFNPRSYQALDRFYGERHVWEDQLKASQRSHESDDGRRNRFVELYKARLRGLAYKFVTSFGPLFDRKVPKYHVIFAGDNETGSRIMRDVWAKTRFVPGELGYQPLRRPKR